MFTSNMGGRGEVGCCSVPNVSASYLRTLRPTSSSGFNGVEWGEVGWGGIGWGGGGVPVGYPACYRGPNTCFLRIVE